MLGYSRKTLQLNGITRWVMYSGALMTHTPYASCPQPKGDGHPMNGTPNDHRRRVGLPPNGNDVENRGNDVEGRAYDATRPMRHARNQRATGIP